MYRIEPVTFLDGLKRCLHGYEVQTHSFARLILMAGLLSVWWHINRREKHYVQSVETAPSIQEQARWRSLLLSAFGHWRRSFDDALSHTNEQDKRIWDANDPALFFHFAHLATHVDIIDCQILSGSRRLLGRKVSENDRSAVVARMNIWASSAMARHATLHAFKLVKTVFCSEGMFHAASSPDSVQPNIYESGYRCRNDPFTYRPWMLYLAGMTIWAYQIVSNTHDVTNFQQQTATTAHSLKDVACHYISTCASTDNADRIPVLTSQDGCAALLEMLSQDFENAESELQNEASKRLQECTKMLMGAGIGHAR